MDLGSLGSVRWWAGRVPEVLDVHGPRTPGYRFHGRKSCSCMIIPIRWLLHTHYFYILVCRYICVYIFFIYVDRQIDR